MMFLIGEIFLNIHSQTYLVKCLTLKYYLDIYVGYTIDGYFVPRTGLEIETGALWPHKSLENLGFTYVCSLGKTSFIQQNIFS